MLLKIWLNKVLLTLTPDGANRLRLEKFRERFVPKILKSRLGDGTVVEDVVTAEDLIPERIFILDCLSPKLGRRLWKRFAEMVVNAGVPVQNTPWDYAYAEEEDDKEIYGLLFSVGDCGGLCVKYVYSDSFEALYLLSGDFVSERATSCFEIDEFYTVIIDLMKKRAQEYKEQVMEHD